MNDGTIELVTLTKQFADVVAVDSITLHIPGGEFFSLLGPSGCGKTTTLRLIAGFERPDGGRILLDGADMSGTPPHKRKVNTVFQSYALFPHLTVADNVAFGLRRRREPRERVKRKVEEVLASVRLEGLGKRRPTQLSGGQQQRVALARALVLNPSVLLLDEPLGALDAKLRKALQLELKTLQQEFGITFVYVTHDQEEALTMSDRIAVMSGGRIEQAGSPREVYEEPQTLFVADFLGVSNLLAVQAAGADDRACSLRIGERSFRAEQGEIGARGDVKAMIRPERIVLEPHGAPGDNRLPGMVERAVFLGGAYEIHVRVLGGELLKVAMANDGNGVPAAFDQGTPVTLYLPPDALRVLRPDGDGHGPDGQADEPADRGA